MNEEVKCKFSVGDVVRLKSGGPDMTVSCLTEVKSHNCIRVDCLWFNDNEVHEHAFFNEGMLISTKSERLMYGVRVVKNENANKDCFSDPCLKESALKEFEFNGIKHREIPQVKNDKPEITLRTGGFVSNVKITNSAEENTKKQFKKYKNNWVK